ncbi:glycosyltransferase [Arsukibacterium indicum]|uniref:Glycosyltransferase n=1 Tax=Arsukibacterium indicum TaxID=2848612 RepID=A0ABS6MG67_9GAMM|nr:glycosyltransferase [Arsukibacterium indicum]MBV2127803.1 glycosyltransferase [Arsukibacterium indicum]
MNNITADKSPRCCFVLSSLTGGGAEGVCVTVASGLAGQGMDVELVVLNMQRAVYQDRLSEKVRQTSLNVSNARYSFLPLIKHLRKTKPDKVIVFNYELAVVMVLIRPFLGFDFQLIARNINTISASLDPKSSSVKTRVLRALLQRLYSKTDHIINQCRGMKQDLLNTMNISESRTSVIYNPVNQLVEQQAASSSNISGSECAYILCIGRLEQQKAFDLAIEAFALFSVTNPQYRLKIAGQGALEAELKTIAQSLGVAGKVDFVGFQADTVQYYRDAKFTLLTSLYEGFPNVLVESITLGTPVVSVNCPSGPDEIVEHDINGYLVNSRTAESVAEAMQAAAVKSWNHQRIQDTAKRFSRRNILNTWRTFLCENKV